MPSDQTPDPTEPHVAGSGPITSSGLSIVAGACWVHFAFDVGHSIRLADAEAALARANPKREAIAGQRRTPSSLLFRPAPVRSAEPVEPIRVGRFETAPVLERTLFDFGAVTVAFRMPLANASARELLALAAELYECESLRDEARRRVRALVDSLGDAVAQASVVDLIEDYVVFHAERWTPTPADAADGSPSEVDRLLVEAPTIAAILRVADEPLSDGEIADAIAVRASYGRNDLTIVDWNAAMVFDPRGQDVLGILEFANVELLEMRFLDDRLDAALDRSYERLSHPFRLRSNRDERRRLAALQMDSALLFEGINNAVKLVGDQFLARLYRLVARRFHLPEWDESVMRKLATVQRLYEKLSDEQATRRMELLEWIIIVLIAVSIVIPFVVGAGHG